MINVLITGAGTVTCQSVIKGLRKQDEYGVNIVVTDCDERNAGKFMADEFAPTLLADDDQYISSLRGIVNRYNIDILIPIVDEELPKIAEAKDELDCEVICPSIRQINGCQSKLATHNELDENGHNAIPTYKIPAMTKTNPYFAKPDSGRGSENCFIIKNKNDLAYAKQHIDNPIYQDYMNGQEYTVDIYRSTRTYRDGTVAGMPNIVMDEFAVSVPRKRTETKAGVSYKSEVVHDEEMIEQALDITQDLLLSGYPINIQCFKQDGEIYWSEINPRFAGTSIASIKAGFNIPKLILDDYKGRQLEEPNIDYGLKMYRRWTEEFEYN